MEVQRGDQIATGHSGECGGQGAHPDVGGEVGGHRYARQPSLLRSALFLFATSVECQPQRRLSCGPQYPWGGVLKYRLLFLYPTLYSLYT